MRKLLILVLTIASAYAFGQGNTLYSGEMVTPKMGKSADFETRWKVHLGKYHAKDDGRMVFEILSGDNNGCYLLLQGPGSYADLDKERANAKAHSLDYDNNVTPALEKIGGSYTYRWADTLSYNGKVPADKFVTTVYHLKSGKGPDLTAEIKRAINVNTIIKSPSSYNTYIKIWQGSHPEIVTVSNLKDGFKQLDNNFMPSMANTFKDAYIKEYGQEMWDKRLKLLPEITESIDVYISKFRKDLSTAIK